MEVLRSARLGMGIRPSLPLPCLGPSFQLMQNITFQTESSMAEQEEFQSTKYIFHNFMERLWAYLTIQQLLEQMWVAGTLKGLLGQPHSLRASSSSSLGGGQMQLAWGISWTWRQWVMVSCLSSGISQREPHLSRVWKGEKI